MTTSIFFDLDGTLTDPRTGITACIQYAMEKLNHDVPSEDELLWCIGPSLLKSFATLVGEKNASKALALYRERFADIGWQENLPYAGVNEVLNGLQDAGHRLFVATSKPHVYANRIVEHFGMGEFFTRVYGSELDGTRVEKADLLQYALADSKSRKQSIMIGDRHFDAIGASHNAMRFVGVTYGFGSEQELREAGTTRLIAQPRALLPVLLEMAAETN
jgi:phosphoglycolate phosphatase